MQIRVFNDTATFCSKIKQIALTIVLMVYELALGINRNTINSVKLKATSLLKKAMYLHGHPDSEVCCLSSLIFNSKYLVLGLYI